jgi:hypothetical protein
LIIILKKLISIALLFVFLFNIGGYYVVYVGCLYKVRTEMAQRLDKGSYSAEETITIKIPFNLPYQADGKAFERRGGEFQHDGEFYKLVKQKIENDTLYVVCIKDNKEKKIFNFMADMVKMSSDLPASSSTMKLLNSLIKITCHRPL